MKTASANLAAHLAGGVTTLAQLWKITRTDGETLYLTTHDEDLVVGGQTYLASVGYDRTAAANSADFSVSNTDVAGIIDSSFIDENDLRNGVYDKAEITVSTVNWASVADGATIVLQGYLGQIVVTPSGIFKAELRGLSEAAQHTIGEAYQPTCRADLGDTRCKVPIEPDEVQRSTAYSVGDYVRVPTLVTSPPTTTSDVYEDRIYRCTTAGTTASVSDSPQPVYDTGVGNTTTDGTAVFTAEQSWTRAGVVTQVTTRKQFQGALTESRAVADWFNGGVVIWESGDNAGRAIEVRDSAPTVSSPPDQSFILRDATKYVIQVGDRFRVYPGCDKRLVTCRDRFDNVLNFRGEPHVPGVDLVMRYPDAV